MDEWKGKHIPCDEMTLNMEIRPSIEVIFSSRRKVLFLCGAQNI